MVGIMPKMDVCLQLFAFGLSLFLFPVAFGCIDGKHLAFYIIYKLLRIILKMILQKNSNKADCSKLFSYILLLSFKHQLHVVPCSKTRTLKGAIGKNT